MAGLSLAEAVALLSAAPPRTCLVSDFDGTLAPIVDDPGAARPLPGAASVLAHLAQGFGRVAVVSGRPAAFLAEHLSEAAAAGVQLIGLYGLESVARDGSVLTVPEAEPWRAVVSEAAERAGAELDERGALERKGLSVTLHWRRHPETEAAVESLASELAEATGLALHPAKMSVELRPPLELDKGTAVAGLVEGYRVGAFLGDDLGDLPAFAALEGFATAAGAEAVRVAVRSPETPGQLLDQADVVVEGPQGALDFLDRLRPT